MAGLQQRKRSSAEQLQRRPSEVLPQMSNQVMVHGLEPGELEQDDVLSILLQREDSSEDLETADVALHIDDDLDEGLFSDLEDDYGESQHSQVGGVTLHIDNELDEEEAEESEDMLSQVSRFFGPLSSDAQVGKLRLDSLRGEESSMGPELDLSTVMDTIDLGLATKDTVSQSLTVDALSKAVKPNAVKPVEAMCSVGESASVESPSPKKSGNTVSAFDKAPSSFDEACGGISAGFSSVSVVKDASLGIKAAMDGDWEAVQSHTLGALSSTADTASGIMTSLGSTASEVSPLGIVSSGLSMVKEMNNYRNASNREDIASEVADELQTTAELETEGREGESEGEHLSRNLRDQYHARAANDVVDTTRKQKKRAALNATAEGLKTTGRATTLATGATGAGGMIGASLEASGHGLKAGSTLWRGAKRLLRNLFGKKSNGELDSENRQFTVKSEDRAKNDQAKAHQAMVTASSIQEMVGTEQGAKLLKGLGYTDKAIKKFMEQGIAPSVESLYGKLRKR